MFDNTRKLSRSWQYCVFFWGGRGASHILINQGLPMTFTKVIHTITMWVWTFVPTTLTNKWLQLYELHRGPIQITPNKMSIKYEESHFASHIFGVFRWYPLPRLTSNYPAGGKLNPRFVCSWRSYARHWMRNAWFWQTIQFMIFAVPLCFGFFSCILQCFLHSWAPKISVIFLQFSWNMQVLAHFCARIFLSPRTVI